MKFFNNLHITRLIALIALVAFVWLGVSYLVADTGYPGGISPAGRRPDHLHGSFHPGVGRLGGGLAAGGPLS